MNHCTLPILIVEDDPAMGRIIQRALTSEGYAAKLVANNHDALRALRSERHVIAFLDVNLGSDNGFELAQSIRAGEGGERHRALPVIYVTAEDDVDSFEQSFITGAHQYITKPFDIDDLVGAIGAVLGA